MSDSRQQDSPLPGAPASASPATSPALAKLGLHPERRPPQGGHSRFRSMLTWPVISWCLWDWGAAAFNAVVTTFVFSVYLASSSFGDSAHTESAISAGLTVAGFCIAILAPVTGQRSDRAGRVVRWLGIHTLLVTLICAALFFVKPEPGYLWLGIVLLGLGNVFYELASVNYNALLNHLAPRNRIGAVSGLGWGMGYIGGIVLLLLLFVGFIKPETTWLGLANTEGMGVRLGMIIAALWFALSAIPVLLTNSGRYGRRRRTRRAQDQARGTWRETSALESEPVDAETPEDAPAERSGRTTREARESLGASYRRLWHTLVDLHRSHPGVLWFLLAAAIFRDGLAGIFTYGGIIAQNTFGFSSDEVIIFAIAASLVAGVITIAAGHLDDLLGPRTVIIGSLVIILAAGLAVFILRDGGKPVFWVLGLGLAGCVGPAQSAARTYLARLIPRGREGEIFGLYATTGRAVSFLAPMMYGAFIGLGKHVVAPGSGGVGASAWGILGIVVVVLAGLLLMLRVPDARRSIPGEPQE